MLVSLNNSGDPVEKTSRHALVKDDVNRGPLAKIIRCGGLDCDHNAAEIVMAVAGETGFSLALEKEQLLRTCKVGRERPLLRRPDGLLATP